MTSITSSLRAKAAFIVPAAVALLNPAAAQASIVGDFRTPTGDVYCQMALNDGVAAVACEGGGPYAVPRPANCHLGWGDRFILTQGQATVSSCHGDTIRSNQALAPVLDYGQTKTVGQITCDSEGSGLTCTDASTGNFFTMSSASNSMG